MALAMLYPEPEKGGHGKKGRLQTVTEKVTVSQNRIGIARAVLRHSPELADARKMLIQHPDWCKVVSSTSRTKLEEGRPHEHVSMGSLQISAFVALRFC